MKNKKVLVLASLLTLGLITGCKAKAVTSSASTPASSQSAAASSEASVAPSSAAASSEASVAPSSEAAASSEAAPVSSEAAASSEAPAISSEAPEVNDNKVVISELPDGDITENITKDIFTFVKNGDTTATSSKNPMQVTTAGETGPLVYNEVEYTKVLKTKSASSLAADKLARVISFEATGKGTVKIIAKTGAEGDARKVGIYNVEKAVEHDNVMVNEMGEYTLTYHYSGTYYITFSANVSIYAIEASWENGVNEDWEPAIELSNPLVLTANELPGGTLTSDLAFDNFTLKATAEKDQSIIIDSNNKTVDGTKYTQRIKLGGAGTYDYRSIIVKTTGAARITVHCISSSTSADRNLAIYNTALAMDAEGAKLDEGTATGSGPVALVFTVDAAGEYAVLGTEGGINIYGIMIENIA